jgi:hypothetical protein
MSPGKMVVSTILLGDHGRRIQYALRNIVADQEEYINPHYWGAPFGRVGIPMVGTAINIDNIVV